MASRPPSLRQPASVNATLSEATKKGSVQVKFADGSERTLPIHGINQMRLLALLDEVGIKSFDELNSTEPTLQMVRAIRRVAADALSFEKIKNVWTVEKINETFGDMVEVTKVFMACINISNLPKGGKVTSSAAKKRGQYQ